MIKVTLLTRTRDARDVLNLPSHMTESFPLRVVKGLEVPGSALIVAAGLLPSKNIHEEVITLPSEKVDRLGEFVSRIVVGKEQIYRNCVSFAAFMAGGVALDAARPGMKVFVDRIDEVDPLDLRSGDTHMVYLADQRTSVHGIVGTDRPHEHLAVWGDNNPLAIGSNADMLETYEAAHILKTSGNFTLRACPRSPIQPEIAQL